MIVTSVDICCNQRPQFLVWILSCLVMVQHLIHTWCTFKVIPQIGNKWQTEILA